MTTDNEPEASGSSPAAGSTFPFVITVKGPAIHRRFEGTARADVNANLLTIVAGLVAMLDQHQELLDATSVQLEASAEPTRTDRSAITSAATSKP